MSSHTKIGSYEAETRLPELLREVRRGRSFTITNRGEPVAELAPVGSRREMAAAAAAAEMERFMRSHRIEGVDTRALIEEGRA